MLNDFFEIFISYYSGVIEIIKRNQEYPNWSLQRG